MDFNKSINTYEQSLKSFTQRLCSVTCSFKLFYIHLNLLIFPVSRIPVTTVPEVIRDVQRTSNTTRGWVVTDTRGGGRYQGNIQSMILPMY